MNQTRWGKITAFDGAYLVLLGMTTGVGEVPYTTINCPTIHEAFEAVWGFFNEVPKDIGIGISETIGTRDAL